MTVVDRIREISKKHDLTITSVAEKAGISKNNIYKWNKSTPTTKSLEKVANVLGVTPGYLLDGDTTDKTNETKTVDLDDDQTVMTFQGKEIPEEYKEMFKDIIRRLDNK